MAAVRGIETLEEIRQAHVVEINQLQTEMARATDEYRDKIEALESSNRDQLAKLALEHARQVQVKQSNHQSGENKVVQIHSATRNWKRGRI